MRLHRLAHTREGTAAQKRRAAHTRRRRRRRRRSQRIAALAQREQRRPRRQRDRRGGGGATAGGGDSRAALGIGVGCGDARQQPRARCREGEARPTCGVAAQEHVAVHEHRAAPLRMAARMAIRVAIRCARVAPASFLERLESRRLLDQHQLRHWERQIAHRAHRRARLRLGRLAGGRSGRCSAARRRRGRGRVGRRQRLSQRAHCRAELRERTTHAHGLRRRIQGGARGASGSAGGGGGGSSSGSGRGESGDGASQQRAGRRATRLAVG